MRATLITLAVYRPKADIGEMGYKREDIDLRPGVTFGASLRKDRGRGSHAAVHTHQFY